MTPTPKEENVIYKKDIKKVLDTERDIGFVQALKEIKADFCYCDMANEKCKSCKYIDKKLQEKTR